MPSRWLSLSIVAFWLATTGWLFWHELWPRWRPGEPPPFHIDLVEEVQKGTKLRTHWTVQRHGKGAKAAKKNNAFSASTWVDYRKEDETFALHAEFKKLPSGNPFYLGGLFEVKAMTSEYRVNPAGQLRELRAEVSVLPRFQDKPAPLDVSLWGEVRDEQFFTHCQGSLTSTGQPVAMDLPPAPVSHNGSVLMPLHPVNRIHGLRPGQRWRQPLFDPFRDAFAGLPGFGGGVRQLNARVLPQPQLLDDSAEKPIACLVIEYESEGEIVGRTWVKEDGERVQRQEAVLNGDTWIMELEGLNKVSSQQPGLFRQHPRNEP
jgi:hypothetical protein